MKVYIYSRGNELTVWRTLVSLCAHYNLKPRSMHAALTKANPCQIRGKAKIYRTNLQGNETRGNILNFGGGKWILYFCRSNYQYFDCKEE